MELTFSIAIDHPPCGDKEFLILSFSGHSSERNILCTPLRRKTITIQHAPLCEIIYFSYFAPYTVPDTRVRVCKKWETWHVKVTENGCLSKPTYIFPRPKPSVRLSMVSARNLLFSSPFFVRPCVMLDARAARTLREHTSLTQYFYFRRPNLPAIFNTNCSKVNPALLYTAIDPDTPGDLYWAYLARKTRIESMAALPDPEAYLYWQYLLEMAMARLGLWSTLTSFAKEAAKTSAESLLRQGTVPNQNLTFLLETACDMFRYFGIHHAYCIDIRRDTRRGQVEQIDDNEPLKPMVGAEADCESASMMVWILYVQFMVWWERTQSPALQQKAPLLYLLGYVLYSSYRLCAVYTLQLTDQRPSKSAHVTCMLLPQRKNENTTPFLIESTAMYGALHAHENQEYAGEESKTYYSWQQGQRQDPLYKKLRSLVKKKETKEQVRDYSYRYSFSHEDKIAFYAKVCSYVCVPETTGLMKQYMHHCPKDDKGKIGIDFDVLFTQQLPAYEAAVSDSTFQRNFEEVWSKSWSRTGPPVVLPLALTPKTIKKGLYSLRNTVCKGLEQTVAGVLSGKTSPGNCSVKKISNNLTLRTYRLPLYCALPTDRWAQDTNCSTVHTTFKTLSKNKKN